MSKHVTIHVFGVSNRGYQLGTEQLDDLHEFAYELERARNMRIERRAAELYAVSCRLPAEGGIEDVTPAMWAEFGAVVARRLKNEDEERAALELYAEMQEDERR